MTQIVELDTLNVDYEQLQGDFMRALVEQEGIWSDVVTVAFGQFLIDMQAATAAYDQYKILSAFMESFLDTAKLPSSIYEGSRNLGVHIQRAIPANVEVTMTNKRPEVSLRIPPYSQWSIEGVAFFNREAVYFNPGTPTRTLRIYQGTVKRETAVATGGYFQKYHIGAAGGVSSDSDLFCYVNDNTINTYTSTTRGLWNAGRIEQVFHENTLSDGKIVCVFGNETFGRAPESGTKLTFVYADTLGTGGHNNRTGLKVTVNGLDVVGVTNTNVLGGSDRKTHEFYRVFAPHLFSAKDRAVTRGDHRVIALTYGGVLDCLFRGQAETHPELLSYMNVIEYTLLTDPPFTAIDRSTFVNWFKAEKSIESNVLKWVPPVSKPIIITARLFCSFTAALEEVQGSATSSVLKFFKPNPGILGFNIYRDDIHRVIRESHKGIEFIMLDHPLSDTYCEAVEYATIQELNIQCYYTDRERVR